MKDYHLKGESGMEISMITLDEGAQMMKFKMNRPVSQAEDIACVDSIYVISPDPSAVEASG